MSGSVLVVEDNPDNMKLISWVLEDEEFEVTGVTSAEAAFEELKAVDFDIILMDIDLPGMNGEEATRQLRADKRFVDLPIVAVTAHALKGEIQRIMSAGFTALTTKPIDEAEIVMLIKRLLGRKN